MRRLFKFPLSICSKLLAVLKKEKKLVMNIFDDYKYYCIIRFMLIIATNYRHYCTNNYYFIIIRRKKIIAITMWLVKPM